MIMENVEEIIVKKNYHELSGDERELIGELAGTEEEFEQMKFLFSQMEMMKDREVLEPRAFSINESSSVCISFFLPLFASALANSSFAIPL